MNQSSNNGGGWVLDVLDDLIGGSDGSPEERVQRLQFRATIESAMALPGKWREEAAQLRKRAGRVQRSDSGFADALELTQAAQDAEAFADELEAIFGPAQPFLSGEGVGVSNASEPPATDAPGNVLVEESPAASVFACNCAHVPPTMPTYRDTHLPTCPLARFATPPSGGGDADLSKLADEMQRQHDDGRAPWIGPNDIATIRRLASGGGAPTPLQDEVWDFITSTPGDVTHQRLLRLGWTPPSGIPGDWRDDIHLGAQMLSWGTSEGLTRGQYEQVKAHQKKLFALAEAAGGAVTEEMVGRAYSAFINGKVMDPTDTRARLGNALRAAITATPGGGSDLLPRFRIACRALIRERTVYGEDMETLGDILRLLESLAESAGGAAAGVPLPRQAFGR